MAFKFFKFKRKKKKKDDLTTIKGAISFSKKITKLIIINAIIWIYLSYILAYLGREQIAENLSINVVVVIISTVITNSTKALFENIFKYNNFKFVQPKVEVPLTNDIENTSVTTESESELTEEADVVEDISNEEAVG